MMGGQIKERGKRLDWDSYDPPSRELITTREVCEALGMTVHSVLGAIRNERLWSIDLGEKRPAYYTTWRAVVDWTISGHYFGPNNREGTEDEKTQEGSPAGDATLTVHP